MLKLVDYFRYHIKLSAKESIPESNDIDNLNHAIDFQVQNLFLRVFYKELFGVEYKDEGYNKLYVLTLGNEYLTKEFIDEAFTRASEKFAAIYQKIEGSERIVTPEYYQYMRIMIDYDIKYASANQQDNSRHRRSFQGVIQMS